LILILFNYEISLAELVISESQSGLSIALNKIQYIQTKTDNNLIWSLNGIQTQDKITTQRFNHDIEIVSFIIAVPDNFYPISDIVVPSKSQNKNIQNEIVSFETIGFKRGVKLFRVIINPMINIYGNIPEYLKEIKFSIKYNISALNIENSNLKELNYFKEVRNINLLKNILSGNSKKKTKSTIQSNDIWYNPDINYVKITTQKDGVAVIIADSLFALDNSFLNKETKYLHLIHNGTEYPISISNDNDGIFNKGDDIIFAGSRPIGDTTWLDPYAPEEVFYFYFDKQTLGLRLNAVAQNNATSKLDYVRINRHIEEEHDYAYGYFEVHIETEKNVAENWIWQYLGSYGKKTFTYPFMILPTGQPDDSVSIFTSLQSYRWYQNIPFQHSLGYCLNYDTLITRNIKGGDSLGLGKLISSDNIIAGLNSHYIYSSDLHRENDTLVQPNEMYIDFITMKGMIKPFAFNGKTDFIVDSQSTEKYIEIPGFTDKEITSIDPINNEIRSVIGESGTSVIVSTKSNDQPYCSIIINDTTVISKMPGLHLAFLKAPDFKNVIIKDFEFNDRSAIQLIESLSNESIVAIAFNGNNKMDPEIANAISALGSKRVKDLSNVSSWSFCLKKGDNIIIENVNPNGGVSVANTFYKHSSGVSNNAKLTFEKDRSYNLLIADRNKYEIANIKSTHRSNLIDTNNFSDVIYISHENFITAADSLSRYRSRTTNYSVKVVDVEDIYKEFNYGKKSPHAIKKFLQFVYEKWKAPKLKTVCLFGDANYDTRNAFFNSYYKDYVPTYGWPPSDYWYSLLEGNDLSPEIEIGRIPISQLKQAYDYIDKAIEYDSVAFKPWMKNFLFLSGGYDDRQRREFYEEVLGFADQIVNSELSCDTTYIRKNDPTTAGEAEASTIIKNIKDGTVWMSFLGHGSATVFDTDGWNVSRLNNIGKYPIFTSLSCNTGAFAEPNVTCRNEDYLLAPQKGFICTGGATAGSRVMPDIKLEMLFFNAITDTNIRAREIGNIFYYAKSNMYYSSTDEHFTTMQYTLLGDPLTKLRFSKDKDPYILNNDVEIKNKNKQVYITETDSIIYVSGVIRNAGFNINSPSEILLTRIYNDQIDSLWYNLSGIRNINNFTYILNIKDKPGKHKIQIVIDPNNKIEDIDRANNTFETISEVFTIGLKPLEPLANWNVPNNKPIFRVINPNRNEKFSNFEFMLRSDNDTSSNLVYKSQINEIKISESYIHWTPSITLDSNKVYWFFARAQKSSDNTKSNWLILPFVAKNNVDYKKTEWELKSLSQYAENTNNNIEFIDSSFSAGVSIESFKIPYSVTSARGYRTDKDTVQRHIEIKVNDNFYVMTPDWSVAPIGVNIVVISGTTGKYIEKRQFTSYYDNLAAAKTIKYLSDSVSQDNIILFGTCDRTISMFEGTLLDSLRFVLKTYGSLLSDSLAFWVENTSYILIGQKGAKPGLYPESVDTNGRKIQVNGDFVFYKPTGNIRTQLIGPASKWNKLDLKLLNNNDSLIQTSIYKVKHNGFIEELHLTDYINTSFDLSQIDADQYPYIRLNFLLNHKPNLPNPIISTVNCSFTPTAEYALNKVIPIENADSVMRGETVQYQFKVENISPRIESDSVRINVAVTGLGGNTSLHDYFFAPLNIDETSNKIFNLDTRNIDLTNQIILSVNNYNTENEIYDFNNTISYSQKMIEDSELPRAELRVDDKLVADGDYVSLAPAIEILLYDNSILPFNPAKNKIRINGKLKDDKNSKEYQFTSYNEDRPLKAKITFTSDSLEYGEKSNLVILYIEDATGNKDTIRVLLSVSLNGYIENLTNYPNPIVSTTTISFNLKAPNKTSSAQVDICNMSGQIIKTFNINSIEIGKNYIIWDGVGDDGNRLPSGVYFYRINIKSDTFIEPVYGKCIISN
jgi:hypothetical protein